ncbi:hypothetical protein CN171_32835 [Sinorhizobium meliloti]|nr:hypothetical protein CN171_32835 [Sinorhizobium meliloti]
MVPARSSRNAIRSTASKSNIGRNSTYPRCSNLPSHLCYRRSHTRPGDSNHRSHAQRCHERDGSDRVGKTHHLQPHASANASLGSTLSLSNEQINAVTAAEPRATNGFVNAQA